MNWYLSVIKNYAGFSGRARRAEYWMFVLFHFIAIVALSVIDQVAFGNPILAPIYLLATIVPTIAVVVRRLHDTGKSGAYYFVCLIPLIGGIWLLVLTVSEGDAGPNQYGPDPKQTAPAYA